MADTKGTALTLRDRVTNVRSMMTKMEPEMARVLPRHITPQRMARVALTCFNRIPKLLECDLKSLAGAIMQAAELGLEFDGMLGHAYLIPYENRRKNITEAQFVVGYKGLLSLVRRSGQVSTIYAQVVRDKDHFDYEFGLEPRLVHRPDQGERGEPTFVYAVAHLRDGGRQFDVLSVHDINKVRDESQGYKTSLRYNRDDNPWQAHWDEMAKKTVLRRLCKMLPVSVEVQRAVALNEAADDGRSQDLAGNYDLQDLLSSPDEFDDEESVDPKKPEVTPAKEARAA